MNTKTLKMLQSTEIEILQVITEICDVHELAYYLIGGTLLGAIRHKGFIPWDDDIDIAMPREDYDKLLKLCETELPSQYYLHSNQTDLDYWLPYAKIRKNGTIFEERLMISIDTHKGIFIDIFPLDNANMQKSIVQDLQAKIVKKLLAIVLHKKGFILERQSVINKILLKICKKISINTITRAQTKVMKFRNKINCKYYINFGSNYNHIKQTIPKDKFNPLVRLEFEGNMYNAPKDCKYVLNRIYGDFMKLPPVEQRITHNPVRIELGDEINNGN